MRTLVDWRGLYINLAARLERRAAMEAELSAKSVGSLYERIDAIDGGPGRGWYGCFMSHMRALQRVQEIHTITHISEDDTELSTFLADFIRSSDPIWQQADLLFLDMWVDMQAIPRYLQALREAHRSSEIVLRDLRDLRIGCTSSYVVNPNCVPRLLDGLREELRSPKPRAIDTVYGDLIRTGRIRAAVTIPFITGTSPHAMQSDIQVLAPESAEMLLLVRSMFRLGTDHAATAARIRALRSQIETRHPQAALANRNLDELMAFVEEHGDGFLKYVGP